MGKNDVKLSTMVGENFEITFIKWLKMILNFPPWFEKILKFTTLKQLKMIFSWDNLKILFEFFADLCKISHLHTKFCSFSVSAGVSFSALRPSWHMVSTLHPQNKAISALRPPPLQHTPFHQVLSSPKQTGWGFNKRGAGGIYSGLENFGQNY